MSLPAVGALGLFTSLVIFPGAHGAIFAGPPLTSIARVVLISLVVTAVALALFVPARRVHWLPIIVLLICLPGKLGLAANSRVEGWRGVYEMTDSEPPATASFFWRFGAHKHRIDRGLRFLPGEWLLPFVNDLRRYNALHLAPRETFIPLRVRWTGFVCLTEPADLSFSVSAQGLVAVWVDSHALPLDRRGMAITQVLTPGVHQLEVSYDKPIGSEPTLWVQVRSDGELVRVFADTVSASSQTAELRAVNDLLVWFAAIVLGVGLALAYVPGEGARARARLGAVGTALATLAAVIVLASQAASETGHYLSRTITLGAGNDPLAYESHARNIMEEGLLMPLGARIGEGAPYFFYPVYSYALAAAHWAVGDDYGAVVLLNRLSLATVPVWLWLFGWHRLAPGLGVLARLELFPLIRRGWRPRLDVDLMLLAYGACVLFILILYGIYVTEALTDNLFVAGAVGSLWLTERALARGSRRLALLAGMVSAITAATRPSFLLFPAFVAAGAFAFRRFYRQAGPRIIVLLLVGWVAGILPFTIRNYVMSGKPVLLVTMSHALPFALLPPEHPEPWRTLGGEIKGDVMNSADSLRMSWEIFARSPGETLWLEARKVLFTLGFLNVGPRGSQAIWVFPLLTAAFVTVCVGRRLSATQFLVVLAFAVSHLLAMVVAYPWTFGYKSILPLHLVFLWSAPSLFTDAIRTSPSELEDRHVSS